MPNKKMEVPTNAGNGSAAEVKLKRITFAELWNAYPNEAAPCKNPKTGDAAFSDECAIRVGTCLATAGITNKSFTGARCWYEGHPRSHMLRAEEVANWLLLRPFAGCPKPTDITGKNWQAAAKGRTGIVFFKDYWRRDSEKQPTGDHIDLWNGSSLTAPSLQGRINNFFRFTLGLGVAWYSDLAKSRQIWLWEIQ